MTHGWGRRARPLTETGRIPRPVNTYPCGLLLGVQQWGIEAGRQAGGGEDFPEGDVGFPQEPEEREKQKVKSRQMHPVLLPDTLHH